MRIVHTSDWHLGQTLHEISREYEHGKFLDWLLATLIAEQADALVITGDIFDSANPTPAAQRTYYEFIARLARRLPQLQVVVIGGNHDSPGRLDAPAALLQVFRVTTVGSLPRRSDGTIDADRVLVPLARRDGTVGAWVLAVPFLRRADLPQVAEMDRGDRLAQSVRTLYQELCAEALKRRQPGQALIGTGHCHMAGGRTSMRSERKIQMGNQTLPPSVFPAELAYVALGHLHLAQEVCGQRHIRYAGSPIPLSLIEKDYPHQVVLLQFEGEQLGEVRSLPVPRAVDIQIIPEEEHLPLEQVLPLLRALPRRMPATATLDERPFLEVRVLREGANPNLQADIEEAVKGAWARLLKVSQQAPAVGPPQSLGDQLYTQSLKDLDPGEVFSRCFFKKYEKDVPPDLMKAFHELLETVQHGAGA